MARAPRRPQACTAPISLQHFSAAHATPRPAALALANGAVLEQRTNAVYLLQLDEVVQTVPGTFAATPVASADGTMAAVSVTMGLSETLVTFSWRNGQWESHTWIDGNHTISRLAMDPPGNRLSFVWPGPKGGVAALYLLDLHDPDAAPLRLTNRSPRLPGHPPADYVALPLRDPPFFDGALLRWTAEDGPHAIEAR